MAKRTTCLCDGKLIGIEYIFTVIDDKQINNPSRLAELRAKSREGKLVCPCGCGSRYILVASERNLREQHFRIKEGAKMKDCEMHQETRESICSKIALQCWLSDKLGDNNVETRVQINSISDSKRRYEFTHISGKVALSYFYDRYSISDDKIAILEDNRKGKSIHYILDINNAGVTQQYPERAMKVQERQGYCLFLQVEGHNYYEAKLTVCVYLQNVYGFWEEIAICTEFLSRYSFDVDGKLCIAYETVSEKVESIKYEFQEKQKKIKEQQEEEQKKEEERMARYLKENSSKELECKAEEISEISSVDEYSILTNDELTNYGLEEYEKINDESLIKYNQVFECSFCRKYLPISEFITYGGVNGEKKGICKRCMYSKEYTEYQLSQANTHSRNSQINESYRRIYKSNEDNKKCPWCGSQLLLKRGMYGRFWGCSKYPNCGYTRTYRY